MSLNLAFIKGNKTIDFPYQTQTKLTRHVLAANDNATRLALISYQLDVDGWAEPARKKMLAQISTLLNTEGVRLTSL